MYLRTEVINLSEILNKNLDGQKLSDAIVNVKDGLISRTKNNVMLRESNGKYEILDGFHRIAANIIKNKQKIKADIFK
jgi:hypothetical protein